ncbi:MAG: aldehyde dehydrogenase family protein [Chloroflexota bacterium]|nr:aldehyde dehydrogenase family protein [Chloroflexota bacterium]
MQDISTLYIGGEWIEPRSEPTPLLSPIDEHPFASARLAEEVEANLALERAEAALPLAEVLDISTRASLLRALARMLQEDATAIAALVTRENGCPSRQAVGMQVLSAVALLYAYAELVERHCFEEPRPGLRGGRVLVQKVPVGVSVGIVPWNVPLFLACMKLGPAIAAGCPIVLKPSPENATSVHALATAIARLDLPPGMVSVLTGGRELGKRLVADPRVAKVSFTGSTAAGREVAETCAARFARCTLELGGKSAAIVLDDVDFERVLPELLLAMLQNNGQICGAQSRILLPRSHFKEWSQTLANAFKRLVIGDPRREEVDIGPVVSKVQRSRIESTLHTAFEQGARPLVGGKRPTERRQGYYIEPTLLVDVSPSMTGAREEIFGPVIVALPYEDDDDAIALANNSAYGLSGSVWSSDTEHALQIARRMRAGTVALNSKNILDFGSPFGGMRASGIGRELGPEGIDAYLETKSILIP